MGRLNLLLTLENALAEYAKSAPNLSAQHHANGLACAVHAEAIGLERRSYAANLCLERVGEFLDARRDILEGRSV